MLLSPTWIWRSSPRCQSSAPAGVCIFRPPDTPLGILNKNVDTNIEHNNADRATCPWAPAPCTRCGSPATSSRSQSPGTHRLAAHNLLWEIHWYTFLPEVHTHLTHTLHPWFINNDLFFKVMQRSPVFSVIIRVTGGYLHFAGEIYSSW